MPFGPSQTRRLPIAVLSFAMAGSFVVANAAAAVPPRTFRDCPAACPEMVVIGAGSFEMGVSSAEEQREKLPGIFRGHSAPRHRVSIETPFAMARYDVTRAEFASFVRATGYATRGACSVVSSQGKWENRKDLNWRHPGIPQTDRDPVVCVSWIDAEAYIAWLTRRTKHPYRLPAEAEWEYAARGGTSTSRYWGDDAAESCRYANLADLAYATARKPLAANSYGHANCDDGHVYTAPVGSFAPNAFGLYDMVGNVYQWTEDCWNPNYNGAPADGRAWRKGDCSQHVKRGGSWNSVPNMLRSGMRDGDDASFRSPYFGFRVARVL